MSNVKKKMMIIEETDTMAFGSAVNNALEKWPDAQVSFPAEGVAYIVYQEYNDEAALAEIERRYGKSTTPVTDEFEKEGIRYLCKNCPHLEIGKDKRRKLWPCQYAEYGMARMDCGCCEFFYKQLKQGKIEPVEDEK